MTNLHLPTPFIFARQRDIEAEANFILAGVLITDVPKWKQLRPVDEKRIAAVVNYLTKEAQAGRLGDGTMILREPGSPEGKREAAFKAGDKAIAKLAAKYMVVVTRIDGEYRDKIKIDSHVMRRLHLMH